MLKGGRQGSWYRKWRYEASMMIREQIEVTLTRVLAPERLEIIDESAKHAGHSGARAEGETHFRLHVVAAAFRGKSRLERHRMVNDALATLLATRVHALALTTHTPEEG